MSNRSHAWKLHSSPRIPTGRRVSLATHPARASASPPVWRPPGASYVICTTPRSGSWLLSDGLSSLRIAGRPREWFNRVEQQLHCARWRMRNDTDLGLHRYLQLARAGSTSPNGVSGLKLHYYQFAQLPSILAGYPGLRGLEAGEILRHLFPGAKFIWLTRRDKVHQAISFRLALNTQRWWTLNSTTVPISHGGEPAYDAEAIGRMSEIFARNDERWQAFFERFAIVPMTIVYEDLAAEYEPTLRRVLRWLGLPEAETVAVPHPRLQRQADARNQEWATRYHAEEAAVQGGDRAESTRSDPQHALARLPFAHIPPAWQRWVAQSRGRGTPPGEIAAVLARHGYAAEAIRVALASQ